MYGTGHGDDYASPAMLAKPTLSALYFDKMSDFSVAVKQLPVENQKMCNFQKLIKYIVHQSITSANIDRYNRMVWVIL